MASVRFGLDCAELSWIASGCIGWVRFEFDSVGLVTWGWPASASFELDRAGWIAFSWIALVKLEMGRDGFGWVALGWIASMKLESDTVG